MLRRIVCAAAIVITGCVASATPTGATAQPAALVDARSATTAAGSSSTYQDQALALLSWLGSLSQPAHYVFDPAELQAIARLGVGVPRDQLFTVVHDELMRRYPGRITPTIRWVLNDAGASLGEAAILYGSLDEYLLFFGSPIPTGGFSGRYDDTAVYDFVMDGEMWTYEEGQTERAVALPGDATLLAAGHARGYRISDHAWVLEYARGNIVGTFAFGVIGPALYITMDWLSAWLQIEAFVQSILQNVGL